MKRRVPRLGVFALVGLFLGCGDSSASDGSTTVDTGTGAEEGGTEGGEEPGPDGPGCDEPWEGWWDEAQDDANASTLAWHGPEGRPQSGRLEAAGPLAELPAAKARPQTPHFRSTLISEAAVLSTGRNLSVSWCLGGIEPNPQGPGGIIIEDLELTNLERYEFFRTEFEAATRIWERHSRMNFAHLTPLDDRRKPSGGTCDTALEEVWFRAQTRSCDQILQGRTNAGGENEFDPNFASPDNPEGADRVLCVGWKLLEGAPLRIPRLMEHESGHVVGLEHEHLRWDQANANTTNCGGNDPFVPVSPERTLTPADSRSVMGYPECVGTQSVTHASPRDMLGAYYTFNWAERRVRDMAPQTGGRDQRYWGGNQQPGVLWYLPFSDHLLEWRFDAEQPGALSFSPIERCLSGDCGRSDTTGHWHPVMGQFTGSSTSLDVFMYTADEGGDLLLRNGEGGAFEALAKSAPNRAVPIAANFGGGTRDQLLWYRPGPASDQLWSFDDEGGHTVLPTDVEQDGWRIPITGHFRSRTFGADILWFDPDDATLDSWLFNVDSSAAKSGPASAALLGVVEGIEYVPVVGNFDGDNMTDLFWYTPGPEADWLWESVSNQQHVLFESFEFAVDGEYHPLTGDFDGDGDDDIFWYRPATEMAGGLSWVWYFDGVNVDVRAVTIRGDYVPYVEDFDSDGCTDILWYDPVAPDNPSPVWRCIPNQKTFACGDHLPAPKGAYPIGFATGGY